MSRATRVALHVRDTKGDTCTTSGVVYQKATRARNTSQLLHIDASFASPEVLHTYDTRKCAHVCTGNTGGCVRTRNTCIRWIYIQQYTARVLERQIPHFTGGCARTRNTCTTYGKV